MHVHENTSKLAWKRCNDWITLGPLASRGIVAAHENDVDNSETGHTLSPVVVHRRKQQMLLLFLQRSTLNGGTKSDHDTVVSGRIRNKALALPHLASNTAVR